MNKLLNHYHSLSRCLCTHLEARNARQSAFKANFNGYTLKNATAGLFNNSTAKSLSTSKHRSIIAAA
jgi:hypothetical protein